MDRVTRGMQLIREVEEALRLSLSVMEEKDGRHGNELGQSTPAVKRAVRRRAG